MCASTARLAVCVLLSRQQELSFARFKVLLEMTDGNLGAQLRKLEDAGFVAVDKQLEGRGLVTRYRLTPAGRAAFREYVDQLAALLGLEGPAPGSEPR